MKQTYVSVNVRCDQCGAFQHIGAEWDGVLRITKLTQDGQREHVLAMADPRPKNIRGSFGWPLSEDVPTG